MKKIFGFSFAILVLLCSISLAHAATPVVVSAKIVGSNTVAIVFSEPVVTSIGSYSNFGGVLNGLSLVGLTGGGSNTIVLTFSGNAFPGGSSGSLNIGNTTVSISDGSPFVGGGVSVIDGRAPSLVSFGVSSNNAQTAIGTSGNTITFTFTASAAITNPRAVIAGHTLYPTGSGVGPYTVTYTLSTQDASGPINCAITFSDAYGNTNNTTLTFSNSASSAVTTSGGTAPVLTSITSNGRSAGYLKIGDSITFTLVPLAAQPNATVSGSYNGVPLVWTTNNNGLSYTGTYTVQSGNTDQTLPIQIGGVTLTDSHGNVSAPISGTDVVKMISANSPYIYESIPVPSATGNANPTYTFNSNQDGVASYGGDCISPTTSVQRGQNMITFINLSAGVHNNCTITVTDAAGNVSAPMHVSSFTILGGTSASAPTQTTYPTSTTTTTTNSGTTTTSSHNDGYVFTTLLTVGSTGNAVTELQKRLTATGFYTGQLTQFFGSLTQSALKRYQAARGISAVGYTGPSTRAALNAEK